MFAWPFFLSTFLIIIFVMEITCHFCFEKIPLEIFIEEGEVQDFIIDCEVCCHPLHIKAEWNEDEEQFDVEVDAG